MARGGGVRLRDAEPAVRYGTAESRPRGILWEERGRALQLQYEYDAWRELNGLNPSDQQFREFERIAGIVALATGEMVP